MADNNLQVIFGANIAGLVSGVEGVKEQLEGVADFTQGLTSTFTGLGEAVMAAFAVEGIKSWTESIVETGTDLNRMEAQLGMTAQQINVLKFAAEGSDTQLSLVVRSITQFDRIASEATDTTTKSAKAFELLGINAKEYLASGHDLSDLFTLTTQKLAEYNDSQNKGAIIASLFGGRSSQLTLILDQLGKKYDELDDAVTRSGITVSGFDKDAQDTKEKLVEMDGAIQGVSERIFEFFKPAIDGAASSLTNLIEKITKSDDELSKSGMAYADYANSFRKSMSDAVDYVEGVFATIAPTLQGDGNQIDKVWKDTRDKMKATDDGMLDDINSVFGQISHENPFLKNAGLIDESKVQSDMKTWNDDLNEMLLQKQLFGQEAERFELGYWTAVLADTQKGTQDQYDVEKKVYDLEKQLHAQSEADTKKTVNQETQEYDKFFQGFNRGIDSMIQKTGSWKSFMQDAYMNVFNFGLKAIEKLVAQWLVAETTKTKATIAGDAARTSADKSAATASSAGTAEAAIKSIQTDAAKAYAGVYGFLAPEIGPFAAVPAAAAYVSVVAMEGLVQSFDVGSWGVNADGLAMLHQGEKVLTASEAQYGTGGPQQNGAINLYIQGGVNDAAGIKAMLIQNGPTIAKVMRTQASQLNSNLRG